MGVIPRLSGPKAKLTNGGVDAPVKCWVRVSAMEWNKNGFPWCTTSPDPEGGYTIYSIDEDGGLLIVGTNWRARKKRTAKEIELGYPLRQPEAFPMGSPDMARQVAEAVQRYLEETHGGGVDALRG